MILRPQPFLLRLLGALAGRSLSLALPLNATRHQARIEERLTPEGGEAEIVA